MKMPGAIPSKPAPAQNPGAASITHGRAGPPIGESTESVQPPQTGQRFDDVPGGR